MTKTKSAYKWMDGPLPSGYYEETPDYLNCLEHRPEIIILRPLTEEDVDRMVGQFSWEVKNGISIEAEDAMETLLDEITALRAELSRYQKCAMEKSKECEDLRENVSSLMTSIEDDLDDNHNDQEKLKKENADLKKKFAFSKAIVEAIPRELILSFAGAVIDDLVKEGSD